MDDWQVGDKALCISNGASLCGRCKDDFSDSRIKEGDLVTVSFVEADGSGLDFFEAPSDQGPNPELGLWCSCGFRKIKPDRAEGSKEDWELLYETHRKKVPA